MTRFRWSVRCWSSASPADRHARKAGVAYADDPSNRDPRFTRSGFAHGCRLWSARADAERLALLARRCARRSGAGGRGGRGRGRARAAALAESRTDRISGRSVCDDCRPRSTCASRPRLARAGNEGPVELASSKRSCTGLPLLQAARGFDAPGGRGRAFVTALRRGARGASKRAPARWTAAPRIGLNHTQSCWCTFGTRAERVRMRRIRGGFFGGWFPWQGHRRPTLVNVGHPLNRRSRAPGPPWRPEQKDDLG
jgi:hypothetical protein